MDNHEKSNETKGNENNKPIMGQISVEEEKSKTIAHKDSALRRLDVSFNRHIELQEFKKSDLLAYWFTDFANYHDNEGIFDFSSLRIFKHGDIVKANLGFNIGNELGGLHYCIVINKNDNPYSGILNVIPLTSAKEGKQYSSKTCVNLHDELYSLLMNKFDKSYNAINEKLESLNKEANEEKKFNMIKPILVDLDYLTKIKEEILKMKHGSIAYIQQITTISKQRVFKTPILAGIKLSDESLDLIDEKN